MYFLTNLKTQCRGTASNQTRYRYNLDETGVTTVTRTEKVIGHWNEQVRQVTSRERGELVIQIGIISANANALPPVYVFPCMRFDESRMMSAASAGSLALMHDNSKLCKSTNIF